GEDASNASITSVTGAVSDSDTILGADSSPIAAALTELPLPDASPGNDVNLRLPTDMAPPTNPYAARNEETRLQTVKRMGGSEETEKAVAMALEWLARHQSPDGRWATRTFDDACGECEGQGKFDTDVATTGLALLCFLGADHTHSKEGRYQAVVQRGLTWLIAQQEPDGDLRGGETMYSHGIASIAIAESLGMTGDRRLREPARLAVEFIENARNRNVGGWRYEPRQAGDTSVAGWQVMALMSAKRAGLVTPDEAFAGASAWMEKVMTPNQPGLYAYQPGQPHSASMTAEGMFIQQLLGVPRDDPRMRGSVQEILGNLPRWDEAASTYYWYYATLAMFQYQGDDWEKWNGELTRVLLKNQRTSGQASGSWDPQDNWSRIGGRVYQTAICTLCLEVYYRYLPMYRSPHLANARSSVRGTVTDAATGAPLPGAMVKLDMSIGSGVLIAVSDANGRYALALPELPADFVALSASRDGYTPSTVNIAKAEAVEAQVVRDFALEPHRASVIALEEDPEVHHLGNDEFEGAINSQFQKRSEGGSYEATFVLGPQHLPPRVRTAEVVLMVKGVQAQNGLFINGERLQTRMNRAPRDGSFGEFRAEIPLELLREGDNTFGVRASTSMGDLDDFEFVNVQIQFDADAGD
ncbi:MAG TPA: carboxypeptidase regulatory-like domain-containing protein, partial [Phycisphaerales bacterium]|nr:carboxypeptidase regulatory-like domain-containing protein [Phycisphaerales bacterium]